MSAYDRSTNVFVRLGEVDKAAIIELMNHPRAASEASPETDEDITVSGALADTVAGQTAAANAKVPSTTASAEAQTLYMQGREKLGATDGRRLFEQALAKDTEFALGYIGLANTAWTVMEFIDATMRAATLARRVSEGERHIILGLDVRATEINQSFSPAYHQLGYAYRFLGRFPDAERAFKEVHRARRHDRDERESGTRRGRRAEARHPTGSARALPDGPRVPGRGRLPLSRTLQRFNDGFVRTKASV